MKKTGFLISFLLFTILLFSISLTSNYKNTEEVKDTKYFAVCGKCNWVSPTVKSIHEAVKLRNSHGNGHSKFTSTGFLNDQISQQFYVFCSKCEWKSPIVSRFVDANLMKGNHARGQYHFKSTSVLKE